MPAGRRIFRRAVCRGLARRPASRTCWCRAASAAERPADRRRMARARGSGGYRIIDVTVEASACGDPAGRVRFGAVARRAGEPAGGAPRTHHQDAGNGTFGLTTGQGRERQHERAQDDQLICLAAMLAAAPILATPVARRTSRRAGSLPEKRLRRRAERVEPLAELGNARAVQPRRHVRPGPGVPEDQKKAVEWWRKARAGHGRGAAQPGQRYIAGDGVPQDYATAQGWLGKAAAQGLARSQYSLASCMRRGSHRRRSGAGLRALPEGGRQASTGRSTTWARCTATASVPSQPGRGGEVVPQGGRAGLSRAQSAAGRRYARGERRRGRGRGAVLDQPGGEPGDSAAVENRRVLLQRLGAPAAAQIDERIKAFKPKPVNEPRAPGVALALALALAAPPGRRPSRRRGGAIDAEVAGARAAARRPAARTATRRWRSARRKRPRARQRRGGGDRGRAVSRYPAQAATSSAPQWARRRRPASRAVGGARAYPTFANTAARRRNRRRHHQPVRPGGGTPPPQPSERAAARRCRPMSPRAAAAGAALADGTRMVAGSTGNQALAQQIGSYDQRQVNVAMSGAVSLPSPAIRT